MAANATSEQRVLGDLLVRESDQEDIAHHHWLWHSQAASACRNISANAVAQCAVSVRRVPRLQLHRAINTDAVQRSSRIDVLFGVRFQGADSIEQLIGSGRLKWRCRDWTVHDNVHALIRIIDVKIYCLLRA